MYMVDGITEVKEVKEVTRFVDPVIAIKDIDVDIVSNDNGYFITNKVSTDDPFTDLAIPTVFIHNKILKESYYIMNKKAETRDEVCMFYLIKKVSSKYPHFLAYGYFITDQEVTSVEVEADGEDTRRYYKWLQEKYPNEFTNYLHRNILPVHSHHTMGDGWSGTDLKQQNSRGDMGFCDNYRMYGVYTTKNKLRMSYVNYFPVYFRIENINVGIKIGDLDFSLTKERKAELDQIMKNLVKGKTAKVYTPPTTPTTTYSYPPYYNMWGENDNKVEKSNFSFQKYSTDLAKRKLLALFAKIGELLDEYTKDHVFTHTPPPAAMKFMSEEIFEGVKENIPSLLLNKEEESELKSNIVYFCKYIYDELCELYNLKDVGVENPDTEAVLTVLDIVKSINDWVDNDKYTMAALEISLKGEDIVQKLTMIDDIVLAYLNIVYEKE